MGSGQYAFRARPNAARLDDHVKFIWEMISKRDGGVAAWLGRAFVHRLGRYVFVSERSLERSERFFAAHGEISTFIARMLPVIRHLISLPAGLARMPIPRFLSFTALGAGIWCTVLTLIGWAIGRKESVLMGALNVEVRREAAHAMTIIVPALVVLTIVYIDWARQRSKPS